MRKRIASLTIAVAALGALALGGSALATASSSPTPEKVTAQDTGPAVQQGDQTTPDAAATASHSKAAPADPAGPNDTTSPDTGRSAAERTSGATSENDTESAPETGPGDGPGGFADTGANASTQQQGEH